jgi:DNA excision repair protein ERCC-5
MALSAIGNRTLKQLPSTRAIVKSTPKPLADFDEEDTVQPLFYDSGDSEELAFAVHASLEQAHKKITTLDSQPPHVNATASSSKITSTSRDNPLTPRVALSLLSSSSSEQGNTFISPTRLETALSIANAGHSRSQIYFSSPPKDGKAVSFGRPVLLSSQTHPVATPYPLEHSSAKPSSAIFSPTGRGVTSSSAVNNTTSVSDTPVETLEQRGPQEDMENWPAILNLSPVDSPKSLGSEGDMEMEEVFPIFHTDLSHREVDREQSTAKAKILSLASTPLPVEVLLQSSTPPPAEDDGEEQTIHWSRSPSPPNFQSTDSAFPSLQPADDGHVEDDGEMDPVVEEGEFARFISEVKGKDVEDVRREIDDEIQFLNQQRKAAMRDSEDITQQMITQIMVCLQFLHTSYLPLMGFKTMLRLFGIPYITAPMEAEAQCAELVSLGLVDGVITDDSDVFLFGAQRVFKNMFNQSKTVECFLLSDLSREIGLERDTLIRLAYLLGSDYVDGLPGVGPVVAMELLKEFPGEGGLHKFKDWWTRVQTGKDKGDDSKSKFKKQFVSDRTAG